MDPEADQPAPASTTSPLEERKSRGRDATATVREVCNGCGLAGFLLGVLVAVAAPVVSTMDEHDQALKGMFAALPLLCMGVLHSRPWVRGCVWVVVALYTCWLLLALLVMSR